MTTAKKPKKFNLTNPIFHDEEKARKHLEKVLWGDAGPTCPRCGQFGDRITKLTGKSTRPGVYKCKDCRKPFSVTVGTVMERSRVPLTKWILAAQFMADAKKSMRRLGFCFIDCASVRPRLNKADRLAVSGKLSRQIPRGSAARNATSI